MAQGTDGEAFATSRQNFEEVVGFLGSSEAGALSHAELEERLFASGRELLRQLYQDHLDLRCLVEEPLNDVCDQAGVRRPYVETGHRRALATVFGDVVVDRLAYRQKGQANLHVADAVLNLPTERHSHGLRRLAAIESARGSFEEASEAVERATGTSVGKRQVEALAARAAGDVVEFYATRRCPEAAGDDVLVISADGKGIVMRPDSLRPATAKAAAEATTKLDCRLSKGEKRNRKRLAEVGAVYDLTPVERTPADVMASNSDQTPAPVAKAKWVTASVIDDAASVIAKVFDEAERRDPEHQRQWVGLVDGNNHQIDRIETEATTRGVEVTVVVDFIHVLEYLWGAAWCFFAEGEPAAEAWVRDRAVSILEGNARKVAAGIRRRATATRLGKHKRTKADACAKYLTNKADYLDYPTALASGWPIASGVIETTAPYCRSE